MLEIDTRNMLLDSLTVLDSLHNYIFQRKATNICFVLQADVPLGIMPSQRSRPSPGRGSQNVKKPLVCVILGIYLFKPVYSKQKIYSVIYYVMTEFVKFE